MRFIQWLKSLFRGHQSGAETVPYLDGASDCLRKIPLSELEPGMVRVRREGAEDAVWMRVDHLKPGKLRHPPFGEDVRCYIRMIQEAFAEQRPLSFEEWEDGFRRDINATQEIAIWCYAAEVYRSFADTEASPEKRRDIYRVIVTCLTASPKTIWQVLELEVLSRDEADRVVKRVYGKYAESP